MWLCFRVTLVGSPPRNQGSWSCTSSVVFTAPLDPAELEIQCMRGGTLKAPHRTGCMWFTAKDLEEANVRTSRQWSIALGPVVVVSEYEREKKRGQEGQALFLLGAVAALFLLGAAS